MIATERVSSPRSSYASVARTAVKPERLGVRSHVVQTCLVATRRPLPLPPPPDNPLGAAAPPYLW